MQGGGTNAINNAPKTTKNGCVAGIGHWVNPTLLW